MRARIKNGVQRATGFATVVTDLTTCHNTWFHPGVDRCFVATEASKRQALGLGLKVRGPAAHPSSTGRPHALC